MSDVVALYTDLEKLGMEIRLDGGWAVDALLEEQTRPHEDVDIVIESKDVAGLRGFLEQNGYRDVPRDDTSPWNFVLGDNAGRLVDVHVVTLDTEGNGLYGPPEMGIMYPASALTGTGVIGGQRVRCIALHDLIKFHLGYAFDENDVRDVVALCNRFGLPVPEAMRGWSAEGLFTDCARQRCHFDPGRQPGV